MGNSGRSTFESWRGAVTAALGVAMLAAFFTTFAAVTFTNVRQWDENQANCLGASSIERVGVSDGVLGLAGPASENGSARQSDAIELTCTYPNGGVEKVSNSETAIKGILFAFLTGFLPAFFITFAVMAIGHRRRPLAPPVESDVSVEAELPADSA